MGCPLHKRLCHCSPVTGAEAAVNQRRDYPAVPGWGTRIFPSGTQKRSHHEFQSSGRNYLCISEECTAAQVLFAPFGTLKPDV